MPIPGRKPKDPSQRRNRMPPRHEWTEVPNVPAIPFPKLGHLPHNFRPHGRDSEPLSKWPAATLRWWESVATMPHTVLWTSAEWQFAWDTALMVATFHSGELKLATEIRNREKVLGTTADYRRDLRIRYVDPDAMTEAAPADTASVTAMADYQRMVDDDS